VPPVPDTIGVVGAGTMGAGIAQLAAQAGARTLIYDAVPGAADKGRERIVGALERLAEKGKLADLRAVRERLETVVSLAELAACGLLIEAAPERPERKGGLFGERQGHRSEERRGGEECE
jgi:3-hydroxybutyryl-CoA dehydrogenase